MSKKNIFFSSSLLNKPTDSFAEEKWYTSYSKFSEINVIKVKFINPTFVRFSCRKFLPNGKIIGRVENANTLHYKTLKPLKGGLFCEAIFGPVKDFVCACGKVGKFKDSKKNAFNSKIEGQPLNVGQVSKIKVSKKKYCPDCDVEYTWSVIRRYQLGYIGLGSPVTHVWYIKGNPSYISILLDMKKRHLEYINYGSETLTLENSIKKGIGTNIALTANEIISSWKKSQESLKFNDEKLLWPNRDNHNVFLATEKDMKFLKNIGETTGFEKLEKITLSRTSKIFSELLEKKSLPISISCAINFSKFFPNLKVGQTNFKNEKSFFSDYKIKKKNSKSLNTHPQKQIKNFELMMTNNLSSEQKKSKKIPLAAFNKINQWGNKIHLAHKKLTTNTNKKSHLFDLNHSSFSIKNPSFRITNENFDIKLETIFSKYLFSKKENLKLSPLTKNLFNISMSKKAFFKKLNIPFYLLLTFEFLLFRNRTFPSAAFSKKPLTNSGAGDGKNRITQEIKFADLNKSDIHSNTRKEGLNSNVIKIQNKIVKITYKYLFEKILKKKNLILSKFIETEKFLMSQKNNLEFFRDFMSLTSLTFKQNNKVFNSPKKLYYSEDYSSPSINIKSNMLDNFLDNYSYDLRFFNFNFKNFEIFKKRNAIINFEKKIGWTSNFGQKKIFYFFENSKNFKNTAEVKNFFDEQKSIKSILMEEQKINNKKESNQAIQWLNINKKSFKNGVLKNNFNNYFPILSSFLDLKSNIKFNLEVLGNLFLKKNKLILKIVKKWVNELVKIIIKTKLERFQSERQKKKQRINSFPTSTNPIEENVDKKLTKTIFEKNSINFPYKNQIYFVKKNKTGELNLITIIKKIIFLILEISDHLKMNSITFNSINKEKIFINEKILFDLKKNYFSVNNDYLFKDNLLNNVFSSNLFHSNFLIDNINTPYNSISQENSLKSLNNNKIIFLMKHQNVTKKQNFDNYNFNANTDELSEIDYILGFKSKKLLKKVNQNYELISFETLIKKLFDKEKKISNNIYSLSYRERWEMDKDWNIYRLYNIPETNFVDIVNPIYQKRLWQLDNSRFSFPISKVRFVPSYNSNEYKIFKKVNNAVSCWKNSFYYQINYLNISPFSNNSNKGKTGRSFSNFPLKEMNFSHRISKAVFSGPGVINELLNEFTLDELIKMDLQNTFILYVLNKKIMKLKSHYIKQKLKVNKVLKVLNQGLNKKNINTSKTIGKNMKPFEMMDKQFKELYKKRELLIRRTKLVRQFERNFSDPRFMMIRLLPVLPPDLRPIIKIGNQIAASDLNRLYQRVIYRNERLKKFLLDSATSSSYEIKYVQRLVQEAVDNLISNGKSGVTPEKDSRGRLLKSLSDNLKGKEGRFRQYLLGKRIDYSGRSVIVVGPTLKLHECGIPKEMALELYLPFLLKTILNQNLTRTVIGAKTLIKKNPTLAWELLREVMLSSPVLLNRAPTLHRLGIQAFQPKLVDGRAILLHPLVCSAFNADFDGDQMAVHIPITIEARAEAWKLMLSRNNLLSPATGEPLAIPSQDMVLGCYYLTTNCSEKNIKYKKGSGFYFLSFEDVIKSYQNKELDLHSIIWVKWSSDNIIENGNDQEEPIEIRLNSYGHFIEIYSKSQKFYDQRRNLISQYIATTPGKILFNLMIQKSILAKPNP